VVAQPAAGLDERHGGTEFGECGARREQRRRDVGMAGSLPPRSVTVPSLSRYPWAAPVLVVP
jgi:hypothetical protein